MKSVLWCAKCEKAVGNIDLLDGTILHSVKTLCADCKTTTTWKTEDNKVDELRPMPEGQRRLTR